VRYGGCIGSLRSWPELCFKVHVISCAILVYKGEAKILFYPLFLYVTTVGNERRRC
jgi:hypothetical protein